MPWDGAEEVTFECEPGTLTRSKLEAIRDIGVTRLSLGIENFDDDILRENGRAHVSAEIYRVKPWIRELGFDAAQHRPHRRHGGGDLGDLARDGRADPRVEPDSVTIYQMELPFNTVYSKGVLRRRGRQSVRRLEPEAGVARLRHRASWRRPATSLRAPTPWSRPSGGRGRASSTATRSGTAATCWAPASSSFSHVGGVHFQNVDRWDDYLARVAEGRQLPISRAFVTTPDERLTRELILQLKTGRIDRAYFQGKFGVDVAERFAEPLRKLESQELLEIGADEIRLTRGGLLRVDQLLPEFYAPDYRDSRYT